ncbi:MAG: 4-(cytidine 5'-diphospho)-2-C-methyl-D-erythritol kinase [Clostridia bacterium]|nr:4-(cytidine 5'-diphospho)-2-C-methyl-D-erythritol kinase [Clostridia bacterium]
MIIKAYAKINLTLDIKAKRKDGYHIIDSIFQSVGLFDLLEVEREDGISVDCDGINEKSNIAFIAAQEFFKATAISSGARIKIKKNIPFLSGLGGGSADAAAVIVALDRIYGTGLDFEKLNKIALSVGADIPFCLTGGTARVGGIGENVEQLSPIKDFWVVIVKHGQKKSTADMYRMIDEISVSSGFTEEFIKNLSAADYKAAFAAVGNTFGAVAADDGLLSSLKALNPLGASISGSGPSHFAIFGDEPSARFAAEQLIRLGFATFAVPFVSRASDIIE